MGITWSQISYGLIMFYVVTMPILLVDSYVLKRRSKDTFTVGETIWNGFCWGLWVADIAILIWWKCH